MNWLDKYIAKNESGYLMNEKGGLFVEIGDGSYMRWASGDAHCNDVHEISKDDFLERLMRNNKLERNGE